MFFVGYIGAPPTMTVMAAITGAATMTAPKERPAAIASAANELLTFISVLRWLFRSSSRPAGGSRWLRYGPGCARFQFRERIRPRVLRRAAKLPILRRVRVGLVETGWER